MRVAVLLMTLGVSAQAADATVTAFSQRYLGWHDLCAVLDLKVQSGSGASREGRAKTCLMKEGGMGYLRVSVESPLGARGTEMFAQLGSDGSRKQWLYMPATGKSMPVDDRRAEQPFLGTDFTYVDMSLNLIGADQLQAVNGTAGEAACGTAKCRAYDIKPRPGEFRRRLWLRADTGAVHHIDIYDKDKLVKQLEAQGETQLGGRYWLPHAMTMRDLRSKSITSVTWGNGAVDAQLKPGYFDAAALNKAIAGGKPR